LLNIGEPDMAVRDETVFFERLSRGDVDGAAWYKKRHRLSLELFELGNFLCAPDLKCKLLHVCAGIIDSRAAEPRGYNTPRRASQIYS
jgi:hypothetical protein